MENLGGLNLESLRNFYSGKKVLITGNTGFKGSWMSLLLHVLGAEVVGYSLPSYTVPSIYTALGLYDLVPSYEGDIRDLSKISDVIYGVKPDLIFHLAAQPLVRRSYLEPIITYETNVIGTLNVLEAARKFGNLLAFVCITTDKCYENTGRRDGYTEDCPMGGYDPYSSSKGCVELLCSSYRRSFLNLDRGYLLSTARAGNVIGGGDWSSDRLIPDCMRAFSSDGTVTLRNPRAIRPWQHVLEPLYGYLILAMKMVEFGSDLSTGFNFGPDPKSELTVEEVARLACYTYGFGKVEVIESDENPHEAQFLSLNINKSKEILGWRPVMTSKEAIVNTVNWYKKYYELVHGGYDAHLVSNELIKLTFGQIENYLNRV